MLIVESTFCFPLIGMKQYEPLPHANYLIKFTPNIFQKAFTYIFTIFKTVAAGLSFCAALALLANTTTHATPSYCILYSGQVL